MGFLVANDQEEEIEVHLSCVTLFPRMMCVRARSDRQVVVCIPGYVRGSALHRPQNSCLLANTPHPTPIPLPQNILHPWVPRRTCQGLRQAPCTPTPALSLLIDPSLTLTLALSLPWHPSHTLTPALPLLIDPSRTPPRALSPPRHPSHTLTPALSLPRHPSHTLTPALSLLIDPSRTPPRALSLPRHPSHTLTPALSLPRHPSLLPILPQLLLPLPRRLIPASSPPQHPPRLPNPFLWSPTTHLIPLHCPLWWR